MDISSLLDDELCDTRLCELCDDDDQLETELLDDDELLGIRSLNGG